MTGGLTGQIVNAERKAELVEELTAREGISLEESVAVGDGANDLVMMKKAGLGIAFNAKPIVQKLVSSVTSKLSGTDTFVTIANIRDERPQRSSTPRRCSI